MANKVLISLVSIILAVGLVVGVVLAIRSQGSSENGGNGITSSTKVVKTICSTTDFKEKCAQSLASVANNQSATPKDYVVAAIQATMEEIKRSLEAAASIKEEMRAKANKGSRAGNDEASIKDCQHLLDLASQDLEAAFSLLDNSLMHDLHHRVRDLLNWLTAVYTFQSTCLDLIRTPFYKSAMQNAMLNATQLTSNAINIVAEIFDILEDFDIEDDIPTISLPHARRLLGAIELDHDGFPTWLSATDRKLLSANNSPNQNNNNNHNHNHNNNKNNNPNKQNPTNGHNNDHEHKKKNPNGNNNKQKNNHHHGHHGDQTKTKPPAVPKHGNANSGVPPIKNIDQDKMKPDAVVAQDGSGQFKTISEALAAYPKNHQGRYVIYVKAGTYKEQVNVGREHKNVFMYGDGQGKTVVTGHRSVKDNLNLRETATFVAEGQGFIAKSMAFENTAGPQGKQAVALLVQSDMAAIYDCRIEGYQDSLWYVAYRHLYRNCYISGSLDFIFGSGSALVQNSEIVVRKSLPGLENVVAADGKQHHNAIGGLVLQNCTIKADKDLFPHRLEVPTYLGRPWKPLSTTVVMESELGDLIRPKGWLEWHGKANHQTCRYAEYANRGPGAATGERVKWNGYRLITDKNEAQKYTADAFIDANAWLKNTGVPFVPGLI